MLSKSFSLMARHENNKRNQYVNDHHESAEGFNQRFLRKPLRLGCIFSHPKVGGRFATAWNLPYDLCV